MIRWKLAAAITLTMWLAPVHSQARPVKAIVTAYCPCKKCCGPQARGITSTGTPASRPGCAVDPRLIPYGSRVRIPGAGWRTADDTGGAMRADARRGIVHVDLRMQSHTAALRWGRKTLTIDVED